MSGGTGDVLRTGAGRLRLGWRLLAFLVLFVGLFMLVAALLTPLLPGDEVSRAAVPALMAALGAGWILLGLEGRRPAALGFHGGWQLVPETVLGLGLGVGVGLVAVALIVFAGSLAWMGEAGTLSGWLAVGAASLWLFLLPAAAEEALFRGYPFQALAEGWGPGWALVVTSVAFGLVHLANPGATAVAAANVAAAGAFLGVVYLRTGSLWWATGAHLGWNWAHGFLVDLPVSGLELVDAPFLEGRPDGPGWLSGGGFGPEGSVLTTVALLLATAWGWRTRRLAPSKGLGSARPLALLGAPGGNGWDGNEGMDDQGDREDRDGI